MIAYSGENLQKHFAALREEAMGQTGLSNVYERGFVNKIREECFGGTAQKVFVLCGLRATGKTFGLLQAIDNYDDTLYITAQKGEKEVGRDYIGFLRNCKERNIIIDEYTWIKDNRELSYYLWTLVENGKRVAITGTHTFALDYLESGELIHRTKRINVNMFTYEEFCRVYQKERGKESCTEYLKTGGIFTKYAVSNFHDMQKYIQEAVTEDLSGFMNSDEQAAKAIVYDIMYLAVCGISVSNTRYAQMRKEDPKYRQMLINFGIDPAAEVTPFRFKAACDILEKAQFIVKKHNADDENEYGLRLVNPSLAYQMAKVVFGGAAADERLARAYDKILNEAAKI